MKQLTVELVPKTCWFSNVRDHVDQETWDVLRKDAYRKANNVCSICGGKGNRWPVECHEIWHYDDEKHIQTLEGLIALCPNCHEVKHIGLAGVRGRANIAEAHLAKVNGWTKEQVSSYLEGVWEVWFERSRYEWELDLSWLEREYKIVVSSKRIKKVEEE